MSESAAVPLIVVSTAREPVEAVNGLLRRQGIAAHCNWVGSLKDLPDALEQPGVQLLLCVPGEQLDLAEVAGQRTRTTAGLPLLVIRPQITEDIMAADLAAGARDTINLSQPQRAHQVIARELHTWRLQRAFDAAQAAVQESRKQLDSVLTRSNDAIIDVQEGILVEANQSWLELVGAQDADAVVGQPVMDAFHTDSHVALKGALTACLRGQWKDHALKASARTAAGGALPIELLLTLGEREGEPCVRIMVPIKNVGAARGAATEPAPARVAVTIATPGAAAGAPAPAPQPAPVPAASAAPASPDRVVVSTAPALPPAKDGPVPDVHERVRDYDAVWVRHIQAALTENRFRLVQQPITDLGGGPPMFDLLIRMLDRSRKEILPKEFLPAAERNGLMTLIDRWVIGAAARFAVESKPGCLFVRLSRQSAVDHTLPRWLATHLATTKTDPKLLCFTVTEAVAAANLEPVRRTAQALRAIGTRFALEHFGIGADPLGLLDAMPMEFVKIDGGLIQGVNGDSLVQSKVEAVVEACRERGISTIAANVEDANTMAVLWQLGVQHLEGFLIQAPEEVVLDAAGRGRQVR